MTITHLGSNIVSHYREIIGVLVAIVGVGTIVIDGMRRHKQRITQTPPAVGDIDEFSEPTFAEAVKPTIKPQMSDKARVSKRIKPVHADNLVILNIMAKPQRQFVGYELLQSILASGLRFGQMDIFHRFSDQNGKGNILFSLAAATEQGTFDINNMGAYRCKGLTAFLDLDQPHTNLACFELMLNCAEQLTDDLDGILLDGNFKPITDAILRQYQHRFMATVAI